MRADWEGRKVARAWSEAVGSDGDIFQRLMLKPFVVSVLLQRQLQRQAGEGFSPTFLPTIEEHYESLISGLDGILVSAGCSAPLEDTIAKFESLVAENLSAVPKVRVLDIGGGEGFLGRWLAPFCERYTIVDISCDLIRYGIEKALGLSASIEFLHGDVTAIEAYDGLEEWLVDGCKSVWKHKGHDAREPHIPCDYDLLVCANVIDHIESPEGLMRVLATSISDLESRPQLILVTLNPEFFFGESQWSAMQKDPDMQDTVRTVYMGPSKQEVGIVPRSRVQLEETIRSAGFRIQTCLVTQISSYEACVQNALVLRGGLSHRSSSGPFILWCLGSGW